MDTDDDELFRNVIGTPEKRHVDPSDSSPSSDVYQIDKQDKEYCEFAKTDPIRRFQFDYDEHVALADESPAAQLDGDALTKNTLIGNNDNNFANVAPGEGQIPTSVLKEREWDIKTYPHLYPDGNNGMNAFGRDVRLTNQQYIKQRLYNVDKR